MSDSDLITIWKSGDRERLEGLIDVVDLIMGHLGLYAVKDRETGEIKIYRGEAVLLEGNPKSK
jgi:hypothetical protein